ncbi:MAG: class I SAM-dependent methyltransferase [Candidatus Omnitrophica bacterium]|nr:class I SAM-dependent methyltransferase [Candidatus Omnitrophota bacterium]
MSENFKCYLCGNKNYSVVAKKDQMRFGCYGYDKQVVKCSDCALTQLHPMWNEEELVKLYSQYSQKEDFVGAKRKKTVTSYLRKYLKKKDFILEVGCSFGDNLQKLRGNGYNAIGIDKDPTVCDGKTRLNFDFKDFKGDGHRLDFIYAIQVLEHMRDPREFICWISDNLKSNGRLLLEFPNIDDPLLSIYNLREFQSFYWYPYHLFFYNRKTIEKIFRNFDDLEIDIKLIQRYGLANHLRWIFLRRPGNFNADIPIFDHIYKFVLTKIFKVSDTLLIVGRKK